MESKGFAAVCVMMLLLGLFSAGFVLDGKNRCEARGGTYVKTVFWYDCIEAK
jgi:hypothetical protein